jgi:arabinofuranan 3-O-arabinosyltransferase
MVFAAAGGLSTRPEQVQISSPDGTAVAAVDENGMARFPPITTDRMDITVSRTAPLTLHNPVADDQLQLPVGLSEIHIPALKEFRAPQPDPERTFTLPCGKGPVLSVDGQFLETRAEGRVRDLTGRRPVEVSLCTDGSRVDLDERTHTVEAKDAGPLAVTGVTLATGTPASAAEAGAERALEVREGTGDHRSVRVGPGDASYLQLHENHNPGWRATLDGEELTPLRIDGWQQAWLVPAGQGGTVTLEYEPSWMYRVGLAGAGLLLAVLVCLALVGRRGRAAEHTAAAPPAPGPLLGAVALTLVAVVVAGPVAVVVPVLAVVAWLRPAFLVPLAFTAMAGAGAVAALGAGDGLSPDRGAYGSSAQLLALTALFAALVSVGRERGGPTGAHRSGGGPAPRVPGPDEDRPPGAGTPEPGPPGPQGVPAPPTAGSGGPPHQHPGGSL